MQLMLVSHKNSRATTVALSSNIFRTEGFPTTLPSYPFPHPLCLGGADSTPCDQVEPRQSFAAIALPAAALVDLPDLVTQVGSDRCMTGEELVVTAS